MLHHPPIHISRKYPGNLDQTSDPQLQDSYSNHWVVLKCLRDSCSPVVQVTWVRLQDAGTVPLRGVGARCSCPPLGWRSTDTRRWCRESRVCGSARAVSISSNVPPRGAFRHEGAETEPGCTPLLPVPQGSWEEGDGDLGSDTHMWVYGSFFFFYVKLISACKITFYMIEKVPVFPPHLDLDLYPLC